MMKKAIRIIIALISIMIGSSALTIELDLTDGLAVASGPLVFERAAADPHIDLPFAYPLLVRTVEMARYVKRGSVALIELSSLVPDKKVEIASGDEKIVYEAPPFPKWIPRLASFGEVSIVSGDQKLRLHERAVAQILLSDKEGMDQRSERYVVARRSVKDEESWRAGDLIDCFAGTGDLAVGDIIVTWLSIKQASLAPVYTIYGRVRDGMIGDTDHDIEIYDRGMTLEELEEAHYVDTGSRTFGKVMIAIGVMLLAIPWISNLRAKRRELIE